jgi:hypothetical protein
MKKYFMIAAILLAGTPTQNHGELLDWFNCTHKHCRYACEQMGYPESTADDEGLTNGCSCIDKSSGVTVLLPCMKEEDWDKKVKDALKNKETVNPNVTKSALNPKGDTED